MSYNTFDQHSGDLGRAEILTDPSDLPVLARHIGPILNELYRDGRRIPNYCFQFGPNVRKDDIEMFILALEHESKDIRFYTTDNIKVFDLVAEKEVKGSVCYLIPKEI